MTITTEDMELIEAAKNVIKRLYREGKHHIGAAVRTQSGRIYTAVHLEAYIGRVSVCAEAIAIGKAISEGETEFATIVAVRHPEIDPDDSTETSDLQLDVVSPCGICRELISDYGKDTQVILQGEEGYTKTMIGHLLPQKYTRT
ncbi:cytidine deaminase [Paenibacillus xylanilyticus]|uniref:Cytidine deaminase n=1 Tax=Paenibacillus xylanilyticus TaxID=248903 RepID=A0A7Y6C3B7_9BACL|nr:cytidine deaminase [Paenibacillus xylanilyticus]NUU79847.1 cytidine deaminase [Paenibacillus xylanilyticus]